MEKIKNIIKAFDMLKDTKGKIKVDSMTDEQLDQLIDLQNEMVSEALPALVVYTKIQAQRRKKAEKEEEFAKVLIRRMMQRCEFTEFDCEDGKIKLTKWVKYDIDLEKLPTKYLTPNHSSIRSLVLQNEAILWVTPTDIYFNASVK